MRGMMMSRRILMWAVGLRGGRFTLTWDLLCIAMELGWLDGRAGHTSGVLVKGIKEVLNTQSCELSLWLVQTSLK